MSKKTKTTGTQNQTTSNGITTTYDASGFPLTITTTGSMPWDGGVVTIPSTDDFTYTWEQGLTTVDQTPTDDVEKAELILAGICPACRRTDGKHDYTCPHYNYTVDGITINTQTSGAGMITVGNHTITEEKLDKLDKILDAIDDIDEFIKDIKILKNKIG